MLSATLVVVAAAEVLAVAAVNQTLVVIYLHTF